MQDIGLEMLGGKVIKETYQVEASPRGHDRWTSHGPEVGIRPQGDLLLAAARLTADCRDDRVDYRLVRTVRVRVDAEE